jgi:hypothetical protein
MSNRRPFFAIGCGIAIVLAILVVLSGVAAYQFRKYQATVESLSGKTTPIMIAITNPYGGQTVPSGTPLLVHVSASSPDKLLSLELWANGQVVGIQGAPTPDGITPFTADFSWTPAEAGTYTLIARGVQAGNQSGDSAAVVVIVGPTEKVTEGGEVADDGGQNIPISNGGGGNGGSIPLPLPPSSPSDTDSSAPAEMLSPSLTNWLLGASDDPPQAPQLTAKPAGCGATLSIHDLSQNEDGFIVFRMTEASPVLTEIATLKGQSAVDWLTYSDESSSSTNSYMVRVFNGSKVADSNIVFVEGDPSDCEQNASAAPLLSINLTSLKSDLGAEMAYCYKSLNGMDWSRWPVTGFFMPGEDGFDIKGQADNILLNELGGAPQNSHCSANCIRIISARNLVIYNWPMVDCWPVWISAVRSRYWVGMVLRNPPQAQICPRSLRLYSSVRIPAQTISRAEGAILWKTCCFVHGSRNTILIRERRSLIWCGM